MSALRQIDGRSDGCKRQERVGPPHVTCEGGHMPGEELRTHQQLAVGSWQEGRSKAAGHCHKWGYSQACAHSRRPLPAMLCPSYTNVTWSTGTHAVTQHQSQCSSARTLSIAHLHTDTAGSCPLDLKAYASALRPRPKRSIAV